MVCKPLIEGDSEQIGALLRVGEVAPDLRWNSIASVRRENSIWSNRTSSGFAFVGNVLHESHPSVRGSG